MFKTTTTRRSLTALLAIVMAFAMMLPATSLAWADPSDAPYASYSVVASTTDPDDKENTQTITVTFNYPGPISLNSTVPSDFDISVGGNQIDISRISVAASGNSIIVTVGPASGFTAMYSGIIKLQTPNGISASYNDGTRDVAIGNIDLQTVIPIGVHVTNSSIGAGRTIATVEAVANVRGMFHIGIYRQTANGLEPVWTGADTSPVQVRTYTCHAHNFATMTTVDLAAEIVTEVSNDPAFAGYSISVNTSNPSQFIVISPDPTETLYVYVFDDRLIQDLNTKYFASSPVTYSYYVDELGVLPGPLDY